MKIKMLTIIIVSASVLAMPLAHANDFRIDNVTKKDLSFQINHKCSDKFGVISAGSTKAISEGDFNKACKGVPSYCEATVFHSDNCRGEKVAEIVFDTRVGVKEIKATSKYTYTYNDYFLSITAHNRG